MGYSFITESAIDLRGLEGRVRSRGHGGYVTFTGDVRDSDSGRPVKRLEYTAYAEMAGRELEKIVAEAESRWPGISCAVQHRIGVLEIGECAVAVVVGAAHRAEAFDACRWVIDALKSRVPIWKREEFAQSGGGEAAAVWIEGDRQIAAAPPAMGSDDA